MTVAPTPTTIEQTPRTRAVEEDVPDNLKRFYAGKVAKEQEEGLALSSCCSLATQATCCAPSEKAACCGPANAGSCGCQ